MFAKVFEQIYDSSIAENYLTRLVFEDMLTLADINGVVDKTHEAISRRTNVPIDVVKKGIAELERPDNRSRRPEHGGCRIVRLDDHRDWGWLIVNYEYYRKIASEEQRREKTRGRVQKFRENMVAFPPLQSPKNKKVEEDADVEGESLPSVTVALPSVTDFDIFWKLYPNKTGKGAARKAFERRKCSAIMAKIEQAIDHQKVSEQWQKDGGQFIPMPATWINQERWDDEGTQITRRSARRSADPKAAIRDRAIAEIMARLKTERLATPEESYMEIAARLELGDKYKDIPGAVDKAVWTLNYERKV